MKSIVRTFGYITVTIALCIGVLLTATPYGLGVSPDSVIYLSSARSLRSGQGLVSLQVNGTYSFMGHFPPIFSFILQFFSETIQNNAVWLQIFLLACSSFLIKQLARTLAKNDILGYFAQLLFIFAMPVVYVHSQVWTEPLMIFGLLAVSLLLVKYNEKQKPSTLLLLTLVTMVLPLTRYAALYVVTVVWLFVFLIRQEWSFLTIAAIVKQRNIPALIVLIGEHVFRLVILLMPYILWQKYVSLHSGVVRVMAWHPITLETAVQGIRTLLFWILPVWLGKYVSYAFFIGLVVFCVFLLTVTLSKVIKKRSFKENAPIIIVSSILLLYLLFLVLSISLFDSATPLDTRILAPIFPFFIVIMVSFLGFDDYAKWPKKLLFVLALLFSLTTFYRGAEFIQLGNKHGQKYADTIWQKSETVAGVKELPANKYLVSNSREGVYSITGRTVASLPQFKNRKGVRSLNYATEMGVFLNNKDLCIVYFDRSFWNSQTLPKKDDIEQFSTYFQTVKRFADGTIYCAQ